MENPRIGLLLGDPCGVGPEVAAKLLARPETATRADVLVLGDRDVFAAGQRAAFDIVGQGKANPEPMVRTFDMALSLAGTASAGAA